MIAGMTALYFEDFEIGQTFTSPGRTVTEADVINFASMTGDNNQVHTDAEFAAHTRYGQRIAHGLLGASLCLGLLSRVGVFDGSSVALLGIDDWRFVRPIFIGDTVHCTVTITGTRLTSGGRTGILDRDLQLINAAGDVVQQGRMNLMVLTRDAAIG